MNSCKEKIATYKCIKPMDAVINCVNTLNRIKDTKEINIADIDCMIVECYIVIDFIRDNCYGYKTLKKRIENNLIE